MKIPVTVITGFLGAGKTTLINNLIEKHPQKRFAIIENEFGATSIDSLLVTNVEDEQIFELSNGCICCSLNAELYQVLERLTKAPVNFNHLLIETTGIADPGSIIAPFVTDISIKAQFSLDSVICLVDAEYGKSTLESQDVAAKQIVTADTLLLNKTDLLGDNQREEIEELLHKLNPRARHISTSMAEIRHHNILDVNSYDPGNIYEFVFHMSHKNKQSAPMIHDIQTHCFTLERPLNQDQFALWLEAFLQFNTDTIFRVKGVIHFNGIPNKILVQSVHTRIQAHVGQPWNNEQPVTQLVVIGKNLNIPVIEKSLLEMCQ